MRIEDYWKVSEPDKDYIHLQYIGKHPAKPVKDIEIGKDYFVWNYGMTSKPIRIIKETPTQIVFETITKEGKKWQRRLKKDRLVAFTTKEEY